MKRDVIAEAGEYTKKHRRRKRWNKIVALLVCVVVFCTIYALVLPAITMEQDICDLPEHTHSGSCYGEDGALICTQKEHQHGDACLPSEPAVEAVHTPGKPSEDENGTPLAAPEETQNPLIGGSENNAMQPVAEGGEETDNKTGDEAGGGTGNEAKPLGTVDIKLLYPDKKPHEAYGEEGFDKIYTRSTMTAYVKLDPHDLQEDLTNMQVVLRMPKEFVDRYDVTKFSVPGEETHEIRKSEDDENYILTIDFSFYRKTLSIQIEFVLSFLDERTPADYKLPVTAEVIINGASAQTTPPNYYRPLYDDLSVLKAILDNKYKFTVDGTVIPIPVGQDENNNPIIDEQGRANTGENPSSIPFLFAVNGYEYYGGIAHKFANYRDCDTITVTDTLPHYENQYGQTQYAELDQELSPGWELDDTNHTVSKTYHGNNSIDVFNKIFADRLYLKFPNLPLTKVANNKGEPCYTAELLNKVSIEAIPSNMTAGEVPQRPDDELKFVLSTEIGGSGNLIKGSSGNIHDTMTDKTREYPWTLKFENNELNPVRHITIMDRKITNDKGEVVNWGLDPALKFTRLESALGDSRLAEGQTFANIIDKITAYYDDNGVERTYDFFVDELDAGGNFNIDLTHPENPEIPCSGFDIVFKDNYEMCRDERVHFRAYSVYRDPENTHTDGENSTRYMNFARTEDWYVDMKGTYHWNYLTDWADYWMQPVIEYVRVEKNNHFEQSGDRIHIGDKFEFRFQIWGLLLPDEDKDEPYGDFRMIDLLPPGLTFVRCKDYNTGTLFGNNYTPEIIENYQNTGLTAWIFHFTADNLRKAWGTGEQAQFVVEVQINEDAMPGVFQNHVYLVEDHLNEPRNNEPSVKDVYDLDGDGETDDLVRHSQCNYTVAITNAIFASKFIAPAGTDSWTKQRLDIAEGSAFDYRLCVTNTMDNAYSTMVIYDTLPKIGDSSLLEASKPRGSEFEVHLRGPITEIPDGYTVYYTYYPDTYQKTMEEIVDQDIWLTESEGIDFGAVTAFKIVANEGVLLQPNQPFSARIPVCAIPNLSAESMQILYEKDESYLEAVNTFAYTTAEAPNPKESNPVRVRIPFAEFYLKKVDDRTQRVLSGAEFTLAYENGAVISSKSSDENGLVRFQDLAVGTYTLTETKSPAGYDAPHLSLTVTITQDPYTMEYYVVFDGCHPGTGTAADPLVIENHAGYVLPATGGIGTVYYTIGGVVCMAAALSVLLYRYVKRKRLRGGAE